MPSKTCPSSMRRIQELDAAMSSTSFQVGPRREWGWVELPEMGKGTKERRAGRNRREDIGGNKKRCFFLRFGGTLKSSFKWWLENLLHPGKCKRLKPKMKVWKMIFFLFNWVDFQVPAVKGVPLS